MRSHLFILCVLAAGAAQSATFNAAADFSASQNPSGAWQYGYYTGGFGQTVTLYTAANFEFYGASTWNRPLASAPDTYPLVFHNGTGTAISYGTGFIEPGELGLVPGPEGQVSVIRWTAPETGTFAVDATFTRDDIGTMDVLVVVNGSTALSSSLSQQNPGASFSDVLNLAAGATVDFAISVGADSSYVGDTADLSATISAVPLPGGVWLLGTALVAALGRARLKK